MALHRLYFERPRQEDLIAPDAALEEEIRIMLQAMGRIREGQDVWAALEEYMGWENLEERWAGRGHLDPRVLEYLRRQAESG